MSEDDVGIPDSDPQHIDPAGDLAALVESGKFDLELSEDQDPEDLREFIKSVENSDDTPPVSVGLLPQAVLFRSRSGHVGRLHNHQPPGRPTR